MRSNYTESNKEVDRDLKNQFRIKHLPDHISIREAASKSYVDILINDPWIIENTAHINFNDENLDNNRFFKVDSFPATPEHSTAKSYVNPAISDSVNEYSLLTLDPDEKLRLNEQDTILPNPTLTLPKMIIELPTKPYVDRLHENRRNRRDSSSGLNDQDIEFDNNKTTKIDSITNKRNPNLDKELSNRKNVDDSIGAGTIVRIRKTPEKII